MDGNLRRPVLSETVRKHIQRYILDNRLKPGDSLPPEAQLAADLGVGRSSIREAMKSLQSLGIVRVRRGEGFFVRKWNLDPVLETLSYGICFNPAAFKELLQIRIWLESATIGEVVEQLSDSDIAELEGIMQEWKARSNSNAGFADLDERFHNVLYRSLKNDTFVSLLRVFWRAFEPVNNNLVGDVNLHVEYEAHRRIFDAIKLRDPDLARETLLASFTNLEDRLHTTSYEPE